MRVEAADYEKMSDVVCNQFFTRTNSAPMHSQANIAPDLGVQKSFLSGSCTVLILADKDISPELMAPICTIGDAIAQGRSLKGLCESK